MMNAVPRDLRRTTLFHLLAILGAVLIGAISFSWIEHYPLAESFFFVIMVMTLIGASYTPQTLAGLVLASALALLSVGIFLSFTAQVLGPITLEFYWKGLKARGVSRMEHHIVVCGFSDVAKVLLNRLPKDDVLFVVKDEDAMDF